MSSYSILYRYYISKVAVYHYEYITANEKIRKAQPSSVAVDLAVSDEL
jgi:hypothetical protein